MFNKEETGKRIWEFTYQDKLQRIEGRENQESEKNISISIFFPGTKKMKK